MMATERIAEAPRRSAGVLGPLAVGGAILVGRLLLPAGPAIPFVLASLYLFLLGASIAPSVTAGHARSLPVTLTLGVGLVALALAWALAGPSVRPAAGPAAMLMTALAAVAEEALFRRFLYARLEGFGGTAVAVLGSALAFALVHPPAYGLAALPVDLGAGLLLSWQRWASGRWEVPAATHLAANLLAALR